MGDLSSSRSITELAVELQGAALALERPLQVLIERNMEALFGVRFVASEHSTGKKHGGRIDSLGLDENGSPVIFEYKRAVNENVINQGLFYLDWLLDHRAEFELLVMRKLGHSRRSRSTGPARASSALRVTSPATTSTPSPRSTAASSWSATATTTGRSSRSTWLHQQAPRPLRREKRTSEASPASSEKTVTQLHEQAPEDLRNLYDALEAYLLSLGDDVTKTTRQLYYAFRRIKNFACVEIHPQTKKLLVYLKTDPGSIALEPGFTRDVTKIGHFGTGNLEVVIGSHQDFERAQPLIQMSYRAS